jgi:ABC-type transport system substrate-binding protein
MFSFLSLPSFAKSYDGIWFMGFNLKKQIFSDNNGQSVRKAFSIAVDRKYICEKIVGDPMVPTGIIPPGLLGYDPDFKSYGYDPVKAKAIMKISGYTMTDPRLKNIVILHTTGQKTLAIVKKIQKDLAKLGVKVISRPVDTLNQELWQAELTAGKYDLFLMGFKATTPDRIFVGNQSNKIFHAAECLQLPPEKDQVLFGSYEEAITAQFHPDPVCNPQPSPTNEAKDTLTLLEPLFRTDGDANFTHYSNKQVDALLTEAANIQPAQMSEKYNKLRDINRLLVVDPPALNLFYIESL